MTKLLTNLDRLLSNSTKQNIPFDPTPISDTNKIFDIDANDIGIKTPIQSIGNDDAVYWYSTHVRNHEHFLPLIEASHHEKLFINFDQLNVPKSM